MGDKFGDNAIASSIGAGGSALGGLFEFISQGRHNKREASAAAQSAATVNEIIENGIMAGAERERQAVRNTGGLREELLSGPGRLASQRDLTEGGFDPRGGGRNVSHRGFSVARGEYGDVRDATGRGRLLESAQRLRDTDTQGLEAAAMRTLRERQGALGAHLASAGAFGSGVGARQQRQLQADTFTDLAGAINQDRFQREQAAAGLESRAMEDQLQRAGLVLEDLFGRDQLRTQDQQARDLAAFQGDLQRDLGFMQDRTQRATAMLGDELARDQMFTQDRFNRERAALEDQLSRSGALLDDQFRRGALAGELYSQPGFGFYDPARKQPTNQGK